MRIMNAGSIDVAVARELAEPPGLTHDEEIVMRAVALRGPVFTGELADEFGDWRDPEVQRRADAATTRLLHRGLLGQDARGRYQLTRPTGRNMAAALLKPKG
jgi:hypothetical protein